MAPDRGRNTDRDAGLFQPVDEEGAGGLAVLHGDPREPEIAEHCIHPENGELLALAVVGEDKGRCVGGVLDEPAYVGVELTIQADERRLRIVIAAQKETRGVVAKPVRRRKQDEEVIPGLSQEELAGQVEASVLEGAEILDVARILRECPVGLEEAAIALTTADREDEARLVVGEPAVDDHGPFATVLVEGKIDQDRTVAFAA